MQVLQERCPYDDMPIVRVEPDDDLYPYSRDYGARKVCLWCKAHSSTREGCVGARAEDRALRKEGHEVFDALWKSGHLSRNAAYRRLAHEAMMPRKHAHFSHLIGDDLRSLVNAARRLSYEYRVGPVELELREEKADAT